MANAGSDWTPIEIAAVVADYFAMFAAETAGRSFNKRDHNRRMQAATGRSAGSIEFKHQNISAVLAELGLPWLCGYKPRSNYQAALLAEIERHLTVLPVSEGVPQERPATIETDYLFVPAPAREAPRQSAAFDRLVRSFDPAGRDARNRALGCAGEAFVVEVEERRLLAAGRHDLMRKVTWVSRDEGDGAGYDIRSFDPASAHPILIEVKTTRGAMTTPFYVTRNEEAVSRERHDAWRLYRVFEFGRSARIFTLQPPLEQAVHLVPASWSASFF